MSVNYKHIADRELLKRFQQDNDKEAFGTLYKRYLPLLLGTCKKYLRSKEDAEDLVMELYEKSMHVLKSNQEITYPKSFMYVVAKNAALGKLRSKKVLIEYRELVEVEVEVNEYNSLIFNGISDSELNEAMLTLDNTQRKCVELFYFKKLRYQQVADELKMDVKAVKSNLQNGKRMLKNYLTKNRNHENQ